MRGIVVTYSREKSFGKIQGRDGQSYFFYSSYFKKSKKHKVGVPERGWVVEFTPSANAKGSIAQDIVHLLNDTTSITPIVMSEILNWKLDAKLEDYQRYFYKTPEMTQLESGNKCFVIGRKGTGKTAIATHIMNVNKFDVFSECLSFKNFPFNELYGMSDNHYTPPNQYITLWKYIVYTAILRMMATNEAIEYSLRAEIRSIYDKNVTDSLSRKISILTGKTWKISFAGTGIESGQQTTATDNLKSWVDRVELLESIIIKNIDNSRYYVLFDELDEDYQSQGANASSQLYWALLTSLFKAIQDIKSLCCRTGHKIFPIIFIRDDIYQQIIDSDKSKWLDFALHLSWGSHNLKNMLAFRLSRASNADGEIFSFDDAWRLITFSDSMTLKNGTQIQSFDYIWQLTHSRPRDFIRYIRLCVEFALREGKTQIDTTTIYAAEKIYSEQFRDEIIDEMQSLMPNIKDVFDRLNEFKKQNFSYSDFKLFYSKTKNIQEEDIVSLLNCLYQFNVIGNLKRSQTDTYFKYRHTGSHLLINETICIHRALYKGLYLD